jgi:hypothetical protein
MARFRRGRAKTGGRKKGTPNKATVEVSELARRLVENPAYMQSLRRRLRNGKAGALEPILWYYAYGKPKEQVDLRADSEGTVNVYLPWNERLSRLSDQELEDLHRLLAKAEGRDGQDLQDPP